MIKSKIVKEIANGSVSIETTLTRLKIIISDFDKPEIIDWVNNELTGYKRDCTTIPSYRKFYPQNAYVLFNCWEMGAYYTNRKISIDSLIEYMHKNEIKIDIVDSIKILDSSDEGKTLINQFPQSMLKDFIQIEGRIEILNTFFELGDAKIISDSILSNVKQKSLDIFLLLEKEFGSLDDYDLQIEAKTTEQLEEISQKITKMIGVETMSITVNNNGGNNQNNFADGNATINATQVISVEKIDEVKELCQCLLETLKLDETKLTKEHKQEIEECVEVITTEIQSASPKMSFLKTAGQTLKSIFNPMDKGLKFVVTATQIYNILASLYGGIPI